MDGHEMGLDELVVAAKQDELERKTSKEFFSLEGRDVRGNIEKMGA